MLKADAGGGGKGMRLCRSEAELREGYPAAGAEAAAAFGNGALYLERYLEGGRHIEVQVLADAFGNAVHLFERECSIQRHHQKLIEEAPSPAVDSAQRTELCEKAAAASAAIGYAGAGTIEFLRDERGRFFFMEMNTRLQVEHTITEQVTGIDIVAAQLGIAANRSLASLGIEQGSIALKGNAIECRINAEDPSQAFRPTPGRLKSFDFPLDAGPGKVRLDTHLAADETVSPHYDSLLAKVIAHGQSRAEAIETMRRALEGARVAGVATTIPLHLAVLASDAFRAGAYDTRSIPGFALARART
jgi:acetyl-CoA carboxylase biotin carboxylase subunit